jgi:flagellar biosynthesis GTPase FlhF
MSVDPKQPLEKIKVIGFKVTEEELQNTIYPVMHDCYDLGIIDHDTTSSFLRFCVQFWIAHYHIKKQQFDMSQREVEEEKKKLDAIIAEKEAWHKWDNSTPRVMEKAVKELERMGEEFERDSKREIQQQQQRPKPKQQQQQEQSSPSPLANLSLEDMMACVVKYRHRRTIRTTTQVMYNRTLVNHSIPRMQS